MRKVSIILIASALLLILCSCAKTRETGTFFVHSAGFESEEEDIRLTVILEEHGKEKDGYFTASFTAPSIADAAKKLMNKYKDCYFATCDLYFIPLDADSDMLLSIAKDICDSNIYPTTGEIICITEKDMQRFMKNIKGTDDIKKIKSSAKSITNTASFFAKYSSKIPVSCEAFSLTDAKAVHVGKATFHNGRKAVLHEKS